MRMGGEGGGVPFRSELEYSGMAGRVLDENQGAFTETKNFLQTFELPTYELTFDTSPCPLAAS